MSEISYPVFIQNNLQPLLPNVTFTAEEWAGIIIQFDAKLNEAMTVGIIMGFIIAIVGTYAAQWYMRRNDDTE